MDLGLIVQVKRPEQNQHLYSAISASDTDIL